MPTVEENNEYDVATVHEALKLIEQHGDLPAFLRRCREQGLKLAADTALVRAALEEMRNVPQAKTPSPGGCPACPPL